MNSKPKTQNSKLPSFCIITPDRRDRPEFMAHCLYQMERQTLKPGDHFIIDFAPRSYEPDLIERIQDGLWLAKDAGYDIVFIIENDDYYPDNYLENMMNAFSTTPEIQAVGIFETLYYHLFDRVYKIHRHPERSSLFCTGFRISALGGFEWPDRKEVFLDLALWSHFKRYACLTLKSGNFPVGIKHGLGLCGGNGHNGKQPYYDVYDSNFEFFTKLVRPESLEFYKKLIFKTQNSKR